MAIIGTLTAQDDGFAGELKTLTVQADITLEPVEKSGGKGPDYRVYADGVEVGAAWLRTGRDNKQFVSMQVDDPAFASPVNATFNLGGDGEELSIFWQRAKPEVKAS